MHCHSIPRGRCSRQRTRCAITHRCRAAECVVARRHTRASSITCRTFAAYLRATNAARAHVGRALAVHRANGAVCCKGCDTLKEQRVHDTIVTHRLTNNEYVLKNNDSLEPIKRATSGAGVGERGSRQQQGCDFEMRMVYKYSFIYIVILS